MKRLKRLTRKKYRITALVLALCMTLSLLPISALAAGTDLAGKAIEEGTFAATGGNVNYRIDGEEIVITGGDDTVSEIVFPDEIDGKPGHSAARQAMQFLPGTRFSEYRTDRTDTRNLWLYR